MFTLLFLGLLEERFYERIKNFVGGVLFSGPAH